MLVSPHPLGFHLKEESSGLAGTSRALCRVTHTHSSFGPSNSPVLPRRTPRPRCTEATLPGGRAGIRLPAVWLRGSGWGALLSPVGPSHLYGGGSPGAHLSPRPVFLSALLSFPDVITQVFSDSLSRGRSGFCYFKHLPLSKLPPTSLLV